MDLIDKKILKLLSKDGRMSTKKISSLIKVSVPSVRKRFRNLIKTSSLKISGEVDANKIPEMMIAIVAIKLKTESFNEKFHEIANLSGINWAYAVTGQYDMLIEVSFFNGKADLYNFLATVLHSTEGIERHETFVVFKSSKRWISL